MENQRPLIVTGLVLIIILALIGGVIFYLVNFIRNKQSATTQQLFPKASISASASTIVTPVTGPSGSAQVITSGQATKVYQGQDFQIRYPSSWGLLTCNNSQNFELDPTSSTDQMGVTCDHAIKPITFLVGQSNCFGGSVEKIGTINVTKIVNTNIKTTTGGSGTEYHWCTSVPSLDVTQRVGTGPAFSTKDYSAQIEQTISSLGVSGGS